MLFALGPLGCASASPRFSQPIAASFAHQPMRELKTDQLDLYYPASRHPEAVRVARRLSACLAILRRLPVSKAKRPRLLAYLTTANFDNAFVQPAVLGYPQQMVLPQHMSLEMFNLLGLGDSEIGDISCHEAVHYVQMQQTGGLWKAVNEVFGDVITPNIFTESWFLEGLATHYEGRLGKKNGRSNSPVWRGMFDSLVAMRHGHIRAADLSPFSPLSTPFGGSYLVGNHFVDWLAKRYGEKKLWELIGLQGRSVFSPFGVTLRFDAVYGKTLGGLLDEFGDALAKGAPPARPKDQRVLVKRLGPFPRMAVGHSGEIAAITDRRDEVVRLDLFDPDGHLRVSRRLQPILPFRSHIAADPELASGLSFTADGRWLYLMMADVSEVGDDLTRLWKVDARTGEIVQTYGPFSGLGGSIRPDGKVYVYVKLSGDTANLMAFDLASGKQTALTHFTGRVTLGAPAWDPSGTRLAFAAWTGQGFDLYVRLEDGWLRRLTHDGRFNYSPRWVDEDHLVFLREVNGLSQVAELDLAEGTVRVVTNAPFATLDPGPLPGGKIAFLDREGDSFGVDVVPLSGAGPVSKLAATVSTPPAVGAIGGPPPPPLPSHTDTAYSGWDHLFIPNLRAPILWLGDDPNGKLRLAGAIGLQGHDRLGWHNWAIDLGYFPGESGPSIDLSYVNEQLAPWTIAAQASRANVTDAVESLTDYVGVIGVGRAFWTTPLNFALEGLWRRDQYLGQVTHTRLFGASVSSSYFAGQSTFYGGTQWGLGLSGSATMFPRVFGSDFDVADLRGEIDFDMPLPFTTRHGLQLSVVGRGLPGGVPGLLRVGGTGAGLFSWRNTPGYAEPWSGAGLPGVSFTEPLRGYEDTSLRTHDVAIFNAQYLLHVPLEWGSTSVLWLLPSLYVPELDFSAFFSAARTFGPPDSAWHRAVGAEVDLTGIFGGEVPVTLFYQFAYRLDDGLPPLHILGIAL